MEVEVAIEEEDPWEALRRWEVEDPSLQRILALPWVVASTFQEVPSPPLRLKLYNLRKREQKFYYRFERYRHLESIDWAT